MPSVLPLRAWLSGWWSDEFARVRFGGKVLEDAFVAMDASKHTFPMTYGDDQLAHIQRSIIEPMISLLSSLSGRKLDESTFPAYMSMLLTSLTSRVLLAALLFKHPAYENEKEYRFLQVYREPPPEAKFRARPYSLVRYSHFDWRSAAPEALKRIVVGPAGGQKASQFAIDCLRRLHDDRSVEIADSEIPYRAS